jgi:class 3 adenylate cyclase
MECPKCQTDNREGAKFCNECAHDLKNVVETRPNTYDKPESYTPKHLADKILKTKSSIIGERKLVTVLFADVANYTYMSEKLDPESVHQIMDGAFKILMDEIHGHKGTINQFTGDGVMALFGAPLALEDHAQDACHAALAIQKSIKAYSKVLQTKYNINFQMRIGINSGSVVVGAIGDDLRMDYTAVGDTTNLAARMESKAKPGMVLLSPNTYKKVSQQFEFKSLGEMDIKGKAEPLEVYELQKDKVYRPRLGQERKIYSEMVGRDNDLNRLELQVNKCVNGEGSVVNIIGEAGIGKSRLISELRNSPTIKRVTLLEGRAISIGRNLSFHPIIDLLKHWAQISEDDSEASSLAKLEIAIRSVSQQDSDEIIPFVATLMGMKLTGRYAERVKGIEGEALEKLILKNVKDLITKSTELTPLVVVIEDLHWADTSSIELLESLFRLAETNRILFINVFRPEHKETGERIVESLKERLPVYYVEINLEPLTEQMSETLIDNMLDIKGLHYGVRNKIIQRAGGNPFFI